MRGKKKHFSWRGLIKQAPFKRITQTGNPIKRQTELWTEYHVSCGVFVFLVNIWDRPSITESYNKEKWIYRRILKICCHKLPLFSVVLTILMFTGGIIQVNVSALRIWIDVSQFHCNANLTSGAHKATRQQWENVDTEWSMSASERGWRGWGWWVRSCQSSEIIGDLHTRSLCDARTKGGGGSINPTFI